MNVDSGVKKWVDEASYYQLLERWRNAPVGDKMFQGDNGKYYSQVMKEKRAAVGDAGHVNASKQIGWE
jgi:hypothetical protein